MAQGAEIVNPPPCVNKASRQVKDSAAGELLGKRPVKWQTLPARGAHASTLDETTERAASNTDYAR
tara:strand:- start:4359 stop:4556 length:198 start_codon:yes stop_codon:yes gene_type:complete